MKKAISVLLSLALSAFMVAPVAAGDCDPGRADNNVNGYVVGHTVEFTQYSTVGGRIEIQRPFLEPNEWVNSYLELNNGGNYIRFGIHYKEGIATQRYISSSWFPTMFFSAGPSTNPQIWIDTWEVGATRYWQFGYEGQQFFNTIAQTSGRWTPTQASAWHYTSSGGNSVPGTSANAADNSVLYAIKSNGTSVNFGGVYKKINWPAGGFGATGYVRSYEDDCS